MRIRMGIKFKNTNKSGRINILNDVAKHTKSENNIVNKEVYKSFKQCKDYMIQRIKCRELM